jgi:hypothetical protein
MEAYKKRSFSSHNAKWLGKPEIAFHHKPQGKLFDVEKFDSIYLQFLPSKFSG